MGCIVLRDRFGDVHAQSLRDGEANPEAIKAQAADFAESLGFEPGESYKIGLSAVRDPGAARLGESRDYGDGGIEWLYDAEIPEA